MLRQRLRSRTSPLALLGRLVTLLFALALVWYGAMLVLLAFKASPADVNAISGYRTAFDWLAGLQTADVSGGTLRAIVAGAGVLAFLVFGYLATRELPRPYLARRDLPLEADEHGRVVIEPRAVERLAEVAATSDPAIASARGRYSVDDITLDVSVRRERDLGGTLRAVQRRVTDALEEHHLPSMPVNVTLAGYDRRRRREPQ
jgi:hypothetical protein